MNNNLSRPGDGLRISSGEMKNEFLRVLLNRGFSKEKSEILASVFTESSLDGVYTHGVNRFSRFIKYVDLKYINAGAGNSQRFILN